MNHFIFLFSIRRDVCVHVCRCVFDVFGFLHVMFARSHHSFALAETEMCTKLSAHDRGREREKVCVCLYRDREKCQPNFQCLSNACLVAVFPAGLFANCLCCSFIHKHVQSEKPRRIFFRIPSFSVHSQLIRIY